MSVGHGEGEQALMWVLGMGGIAPVGVSFSQGLGVRRCCCRPRKGVQDVHPSPVVLWMADHMCWWGLAVDSLVLLQ